MEVKTDTFNGYTVDVELHNEKTGDSVGVNVDGPYHWASKRQTGKTNTRDYILNRYYLSRKQRYETIKVEEVRQMSRDYIAKRLALRSI